MSEPFYVKDCALITCMGGVEPAMNLRELRERIAVCPAECLFHTFCETVLRPSFDDPEFRNDLAVWAARDLRDRTLAERLGAINPYQKADIEALRTAVVEILDDRLGELQMIPWAPRGLEFRFMKAVTIVFDTSLVLNSLSDLIENLPKMTTSSVYFHFVSAQLRPPQNKDDFSTWLSKLSKEHAGVVEALSNIDFYYMTLAELKSELASTLKPFAGKV